MFFDVYNDLCKSRGVSVYKVCTDLGLNRSAVAKWKNGSIPNGVTLSLIAEYFNVSADCLLGKENDKPERESVLSVRDRSDIAKDLERFMGSLESADGLMFDGEPMSDAAKASIMSAIQLGLEAAKSKNKERFTPKKYRGR